MEVNQKNPSAVALGRKGGLKGGPARAAKLTPEQRSESARKAVEARWAKSKPRPAVVKDSARVSKSSSNKTSDATLLALLKQIKATEDPIEIKRLSNEIERVIFHRQYRNS